MEQKEVSLTKSWCYLLFRLLQLSQLPELRQLSTAQTASPVPRDQSLPWNSLEQLWNGMSPLSTSLWLYPLATSRKIFRCVLKDGTSLVLFPPDNPGENFQKVPWHRLHRLHHPVSHTCCEGFLFQIFLLCVLCLSPKGKCVPYICFSYILYRSLYIL